MIRYVMLDASKRKVACMLAALSHDLGNTAQVHPQDRDGGYGSAEVHRTTACETGQRDGGWEKTLVYSQETQ